MSLAEQSQQWYPTSVKVTVLQAKDLRLKGKNGTNDAYAIMQVAKDKFSTSVAEKSVTPMWKEEATFDLPLFQQGSADRSTLYVQVMHRALMGMDKMLGQAIIDLVQLQANKSRNKTDWYKLLNKSGKQDKERGEVQLDIQFLRSNMTASMYDLSAQDKPRSRMGKLKDKLRGKHREGHSDSISAIVPSVSQGLTDSEGEEGNEDDAKTGTQKSSLSLLTPKTNLQRNISQSMSQLGSGSEWDTTSKDHQDPSDGKKIFGFLTHKRSGSSDSKVSHGPLSLLGQHKQAPAEQVTICINGSHVYNEEPQAKPSHTGSALSLSGSPRGSTENLHRVGKGDDTGSSADIFKGFEKMKPEKVEQERKKQEEQEREGKRQEEQEKERKKQEERERERKRQEEQERERKRQEEQERERKRQEELERERKKQEEQEREKKRQEELEKKKVEERERERKRQEEQERERKRLEEQEREKKRQEELEKKKVEERERERKKQEEQERKRLEEQERERKRQEELDKKKVEERERERKKQEEQERERNRLEEQERERKRQEELDKKKVEDQERERKKQEEHEKERKMQEDQERERKRQEEQEKERKRQEEQGKRNQEKISQEVNTKVEQRPGKETQEVYSSNPFDDTNSSSPFEESILDEPNVISSGRPSRLTRVSAVKPSSTSYSVPAPSAKLFKGGQGLTKPNQELPGQLGGIPVESLVQPKKKCQAPLPPGCLDLARTENPITASVTAPLSSPGQGNTSSLAPGSSAVSMETGMACSWAGKRPAPQPPSRAPLAPQTQPVEESSETGPCTSVDRRPDSQNEDTILEYGTSVTETAALYRKETDSTQTHVACCLPGALTDDVRKKVPNAAEGSTIVGREDGLLQAETLTAEEGKASTTKAKLMDPEPKGCVNQPEENVGNKVLPGYGRRDEEDLPDKVQRSCSSFDHCTCSQSAADDVKKPCVPMNRSATDYRVSVPSWKKKHAPAPPATHPSMREASGDTPEWDADSMENLSGVDVTPKVAQMNKQELDKKQAPSQSSKGQWASGSFKSTSSPTTANFVSHESSGPASTTSGRRSALQASVLSCEPHMIKAQKIDGGGGTREKEGGPVSPLHRRHPVKPLRTAEIQSVTSAAVAPVGHDVGVQAAISEKSKEPEAKEEGPYSQLTRSELIALLVKQQAQLADQSKKIRTLEEYIDNLLVRVMEENPSILMDLSGSKKAV
ncbi:uncharacterized protein rab11fip1b isoform X1 [Paramormyrops kingsleyae]|uniref:uncharacterized protein rab11fip1b isoform X1 n=1 Tax=Paramormyrops kingsleyae TaxID=1676925 RepID=UPI003B971F6B